MNSNASSFSPPLTRKAPRGAGATGDASPAREIMGQDHDLAAAAAATTAAQAPADVNASIIVLPKEEEEEEEEEEEDEDDSYLYSNSEEEEEDDEEGDEGESALASEGAPCFWLRTQLEQHDIFAEVQFIVDSVFVLFGEESSGNTCMQPCVVFLVPAQDGGAVFGVYQFERQMMCFDIDRSNIAPQLRKKTVELVWGICSSQFGFMHHRTVNGSRRNIVDIGHIGSDVSDVKVVARTLIRLKNALNE